MRKLAALITAFAAAASFAAAEPPASADKPLREFLPAEDFTLEGYCSFPLAVNVLANREYTMTFSDGSKQIITGTLKVELTNLETGKSMTANIPGPGVFVFGVDSLSVRLSGTTFLFLSGQESGLGHPVVWLTSGPDRIRVDETGVHLLSYGHIQTDVCAALA